MGFSVSRESLGRFIAVDETVIFNLSGRAYLWAAREVRSGEVVAVQCPRGRGLGECLRFLEKVKGRFRGRPTVYTDGDHGTHGL
jgi:hypothetical protein